MARVRIDGPSLTKAGKELSPFVAPDLNLTLAEELMKDTPGFKAYVWDASIKDFAEREECVTSEAADAAASAGAGASGSSTGADATADVMDDAAEDDRGSSPWITRAAKRHKRCATLRLNTTSEGHCVRLN